MPRIVVVLLYRHMYIMSSASVVESCVSSVLIRFRAKGRQSKKSASAPLLKLCLLQIVLQLLAPARVAELAQRLGLDLTDTLARHVELLSDLFEGALAAVLQTET